MKKTYTLPFILIFFLLKAGFTSGATFTVTNNAESGAGSLADAINSANTSPGPDTIKFAIPSGSVADLSITLSSPLPVITDDVVINATSQPSAKAFGNSVARIQITAVTPLDAAFDVQANNVAIEGFFIHHFVTGILFSGLNPAIGGTNSGNVISDCSNACIWVSGAATGFITNNFIGVDTTGDNSPGSPGNGIVLGKSTHVTIGGKEDNTINVVSGNVIGIKIDSCSAITLSRNYIGTNWLGTAVLANGTGITTDGLTTNVTIGGTDAKYRNVISGNTGDALDIHSNTTAIQGNYIGVGADGVTAMGNGGNGVLILDNTKIVEIGGNDSTGRNIIAYSEKNAVQLDSADIKFVNLRFNSMFCNGGGIALNGANEGIQAPVLEIVTTSGVSGTAPPFSIVDLFSVGSCKNDCEGASYLATVQASSSGVFSISIPIDSTESVTVMATDSSENSSEFSNCKSPLDSVCIAAEFIAENANELCIGDSVHFIDQSLTIPGSTITSWNWNLGNGSTSTEQNPSAYYASDTSYTVTLTVTNDQGCTSTVSNVIDVVFGVKAKFMAPKKVCQFTPVQFEDSSVAYNQTELVSFDWNFGDGTTSTGRNPVHIYTVPNDYTVMETVHNNLGCVDIDSFHIKIRAIPQVAFEITDSLICPGVAVKFKNNSSAGTDENVLTAFWDFGDGTTSTDKNPTHTFNEVGGYVVTLTITNTDTCTSSLSDTVDVYGAAVASFTAVQDTGFTFSFENTSFASPLATYTWTFGDGTTSTDRSPVHTYGAAGTYAVCLNVSDNACSASSDSSCMSIVISGLANLQFANDISIVPNPASDQLNIVYSEQKLHLVSVSLVSMTGVEMLVNHNGTNHSGKISFSVKSLPAGVYLVNVQTDQGRIQKKVFIIKK